MPAAVSGPLVVGLVVERTPEEQKNGKTINWCRVDVGPEHNEPGGAPRGIVCGAHNFDVGDSRRRRAARCRAARTVPDRVPQDVRARVRRHDLLRSASSGLGEDHAGIIVLSRLGIEAAPRHRRARAARPGRGGPRDQRDPRPRATASRCAASPASTACPRARGSRTRPADEPAARRGRRLRRRDRRRGPDQRRTGRRPVRRAGGPRRAGERPVAALDAAPAAAGRHAPDQPRGRRHELRDARPGPAAARATTWPRSPRRSWCAGRCAGEKLRTLDDVERVLDPEDLLITDSPDGVRASRPIGLAARHGRRRQRGRAGHHRPARRGRALRPDHRRPHRATPQAAERGGQAVRARRRPPARSASPSARAVALLTEYGGGVADAEVTDVDNVVPAGVVRAAVRPARASGRRRVHGRRGARRAHVDRLHVSDEGRTPSGSRRRPGGPTSSSRSTWSRRSRDCTATTQIPSILPSAPGGRGLTERQRSRRSVARALAESGLVEVLSYPFVGTDQLDALGLPADDARRRAVRLVNPLSDEQPFMRTNLLVTLLDAARRNVSRGATDVAIFEIGLVTRPLVDAPAAPRLPGGVRPSDAELAAIDAAVPPQPRRVAGVLAGAARALRLVGHGASRRPHGRDRRGTPRRGGAPGRPHGLGRRGPHAVAPRAVRPPDGGRRARRSRRGAAPERRRRPRAAGPGRRVRARPRRAARGGAGRAATRRRAVSTFPVAKEDIALVVPADVPAADVLDAVRVGAVASPAGDVVEEIHLFDVYEGEQVGAGNRSLAFALRLRADDRTLTAQETAGVRDSVVAEANRRFGATLRA